MLFFGRFTLSAEILNVNKRFCDVKSKLQVLQLKSIQSNGF
uniref:Uncharacterized protein n=1 Tax=Anguilla anguilla TaxID=7936 RepID=A0A0E9VJU4_ANGAN